MTQTDTGHDDTTHSPEVEAYYSDKKLFYRNVFFLLFGTFGMGLALGVAGNLVPLHMDRIGMNATQIALGFSINGWLIAFLMIYIAFKSDNCQSRLGRRIPFLLIAMPPVVASLILFPHTHTILTCAIAFAAYRFFLNFKEQTYPFLSYDIAPKEFWGRIWAVQMAGGAVGAWIANVVLMRLVGVIGEANVFYVAAAILAATTLVTIIFVKEPPIRITNPKPFNLSRQLKIGFGDKRNWLLFIGFALGVVITIPFPTFIVLQAKRNVLLTDSQIGWVMSWMAMAGLVVAFPAGWLTDKIGSIKTAVLGYAFAIAACVVGYPAKSTTMLSISVICLSISGTLIYNAMLIFLVQGISRSILASFSACNGMFSAFFSATIQVICGGIIDTFDGNYALAFPFGVILGGIGIPMLILVSYWRKKIAIVEAYS